MIGKFVSLIFTLISLNTYADILIIGDSHTTGPFGQMLHKNLTSKLTNEIILTYGHSSSAPIHWMSEKPTKLSGGINHHFSIDGNYYSHPSLPNWREKQDSLSLLKLLKNPVIHPKWKTKLTREVQLDTIIIALGANDRNAVSDPSGNQTPQYTRRIKIVQNLLKELGERNIKCIWIAPPSSPTRSAKVEETTMSYLSEGIGTTCPIFDSRIYKATSCDKVHFSCPEGYPKAKAWADEVTDFILSYL
jgi:hypothetical protein